MARKVAPKERRVTSAERKRMELYRKKLVAKSEALREKRGAVIDSALLGKAKQAETTLMKVSLQNRTKFGEAATTLSELQEELNPLRARPIWVRAYYWHKYRKIRKQMLHHAKVSRCMREDLLEPELLAESKAAEKAFKTAPIVGDFAAFNKAGEQLNDVVERVSPSARRSRFGENLEMAVVAIAVALGFRTYFLQPFKIPTGSMQPSLYGQTFEPGETPSPLIDKPWIPVGLEQNRFAQYANPFHLIKGFTTGRWYREYRAPMDGRLIPDTRRADRMGNVPCYMLGPAGRSRSFSIHSKMLEIVRDRSSWDFKKGELIVAATRSSGDHILVNKMGYNFGRPDRGDIFVFSTRNVADSGVNPMDHYIKRLVGMPGEKIQLGRDRRLIADGEPVMEPAVIRRNYRRRYDGKSRLYKDLETETGIQGYSSMWRLSGTDGAIQLSDEEYLPMGDNTNNSLDGRKFGGIHRDDVVGPASFIYWPFQRFGTMDRDVKRWGDRLDGAIPEPGWKGVPPIISP